MTTVIRYNIWSAYFVSPAYMPGYGMKVLYSCPIKSIILPIANNTIIVNEIWRATLLLFYEN